MPLKASNYSERAETLLLPFTVGMGRSLGAVGVRMGREQGFSTPGSWTGSLFPQRSSGSGHARLTPTKQQVSQRVQVQPARLPSSTPLALPVYRPEERAQLRGTRACRYQNKRRAARVPSQCLPCGMLCHRHWVLETAEKHLESPRSAPSHQLSPVTEMPYHLPSPHGSLKGLRTGTGDTAASGVTRVILDKHTCSATFLTPLGETSASRPDTDRTAPPPDSR